MTSFFQGFQDESSEEALSFVEDGSVTPQGYGATEGPTPAFTSPLDRWTFREYGKPTSMLDDTEMAGLINHVLKTADNLVDYWKPRNERMMQSQTFWELGSRYSEWKSADGKENTQQSSIVELNDGYTTIDKITSMVAGAKWGLSVRPKSFGYEDMAQDIEDMVRWAEDKIDKKYSLGLHSKVIRDEVHFAALRGWITGLLVPNPNDTYLPWSYILEDPLFVYPRYSGDELIQVVRRYSVSVFDAQNQYGFSMEGFAHKDDDDEVEITDYFDTVYRITLLSEGGQSPVTKQYVDRIILQPLTMHGYTDLTGKAINPWIIVAPRGSPTRKFSENVKGVSRDKAVALIGLDAIYPVRGVIEHIEKLMSMFVTEIAKGVNPARIVFYNGVDKPEVLDLGEGAENYYIMGTQDARILESTAARPETAPYLQILSERLQKGSLPSVLYGQSGFSLAGYAINLLTQGASDVVQPILMGVQRYRELKNQRMLEMYANIGYSFAGPLSFSTQDSETGIKYASGHYIVPAMIFANGVDVEVTYEELTPRDMIPLLSAVIGAYQAGLMPLEDAMNTIGIHDTRQAKYRLAEGLNYKDPLVLKHLSRIAGERSGSSLLKEAVERARIEEMMIMQAQSMGAAGSPEGPPTPGGGENRGEAEASPPSAQNPITAAANQLNNVSAAVNVGSGGTPPNADPIVQFLTGGA